MHVGSVSPWVGNVRLENKLRAVNQSGSGRKGLLKMPSKSLETCDKNFRATLSLLVELLNRKSFFNLKLS